MANTLERIIPGEIKSDDLFASRSLQLHLERYEFAKNHLLPGRVLDIACGVGYGSSLISKDPQVTEITGVDISEEAIQYAKQHYADEKIKFVSADVIQFKDEKGFNTIVSLETIEHLHQPEEVVKHFFKLLQPGGRLIISAPVTPSMDANPFHVNDFTPASFRRICKSAGFIETDSFQQTQSYSFKQALFPGKNKIREGQRKGLIKYYFSHPGKFFLRLRSLFGDGLNNKYLTLVLQKAD